MKNLRDYVRNINNFPKEGITFRDITTVLQNKEGLKLAIDEIQDKLSNIDFDIVVGPESRGFIFGMPIAYNLNKAFVPVRKKGKLPFNTISQKYDLEYGSAEIEIHSDSINAGDKVVIIDDLLATGGTMKAAIELIERLGGEVVTVCTLIELVDLGGRALLNDYTIKTCIEYEGE